MEKRNVVVELSVNFALEVMDFSELLEKERKFVVAKQLLRSGTSVGANVHEAQSAESKSDFIHKMKIADKELRESAYWMMLCNKSNHYPKIPAELNQIFIDLRNVLSKIIASSKRSL